MTLRDLVLRLRALVFPRRVERELDDELAFHIEREAQKHIARGLSPAEARRAARARFGPVPLMADECRDARGTSAVEDLARDVLYAFRTFRRAPLAALTIVATVALGLGLVTVVFTFYNFGFLRVDAVRNPGELFGVLRPVTPGSEARLPFTRRDYEAMRAETTVFTDLFATIRPVRARLEGRSVSSALVTGNFFQTLGVSPVLGRALTPQDDEPGGAQPVIALSHRGWQTLFAADPGVIGRSVRINGSPYEVVGVMPEDFRGLAIGPPDYWAPLGLASRFRVPAAGADDIAVDVVGRLKQGLSREAAAGALTAWASRRADANTSPRQPVSITLEPRQGTLSADVIEMIAVFVPLFFAFGLILLIACANVANLQLARGVSRQREIGIRLSLGASRRRVVRQLLTESLLLATAAAACGLGVSRLFQEGAAYAVTATMPAELAGQISIGVLPVDWRVLAFLVVGAVVATLFFGLAPALQTTRLDLVRSMRGEVTRDARPGRARHALVAIQVGASALLLVCAGVLLRSTTAAARVDAGVRTSDTLIVSIDNEPRRAALLQAAATHPIVAAVAASSRPALAVVGSPDTSRRIPVERIAASAEYFDVLDLRVVSGRGFTPAERSIEAGVAVVTDTIARELWPAGGAVGQVVRLDASGSTGASPVPSRALAVVGVVRDVNGPLAPDFFPSRAVYVPTMPEATGTLLTLRVRGDPDRARQVLLDDLTQVDPGLGEITTMRSIARMQIYVLGIAFWVAVVLGGLALVLTVSGLFSVLSYLVEQRAKDIGVHMAVGATTRDAARLVLSQLLRPVCIGLVAGVALAAAVATVLMALSAGEVGTIIKVFDPAAYTMGLSVIVVSCLLAAALPALRAARIDPIATLRQD